jgi:hypothetical protein
MSSSSTRFTDLDEEAVSELPTPLEGYENEPFESLEKSVEPIEHFFNGIGTKVFIAKENSKEAKEGLTQDESASIRLYTMSFSGGPSLYKVLNQTLRSEDRQNVKPWFKYLKLFLTGLRKLPSHPRTVWRGIRDVDMSVQYPKGKKCAWWGISSCTSDLNLLQSAQFLGQTGNRTLFSIECQNGKSISLHSQYKSEEEIILMPGFYFEVIGQISTAEGLRIIHLQEITPLTPNPPSNLPISKSIY